MLGVSGEGITVMSIALGRSSSGGDHRIERPGFARSNMACVSAIYSPAEEAEEDRRFGAAQQLVSEDRVGLCLRRPLLQ
ncbi:UNVERIFIED_CONTAM: hypothetical protein Sradi_5463200 [Sesamum radiatum]|uniref:Uncharacterized protein n=1 Tax=Sesamum radiatum TaxID=300843 RepID=A0AAW2LBU7_SESRA